MKRVYWQWQFITAGTPDSRNRNISPKSWTVLRSSDTHHFIYFFVVRSLVVSKTLLFGYHHWDSCKLCRPAVHLLTIWRQGELPVLHTLLILHTSRPNSPLHQLWTPDQKSSLATVHVFRQITKPKTIRIKELKNNNRITKPKQQITKDKQNPTPIVYTGMALLPTSTSSSSG